MAMSVVYTTFGGMLIHENRGGTERQYISDPLGSLVGELDSTQAVTYTAEYWPYGEIQTETGTNTSNWSFVGLLGYLKDLASLLYVRARHYLTQKARWLTVDPLWPNEGAYMYVSGLPASAGDPTGMLQIDLSCRSCSCYLSIGRAFGKACGSGGSSGIPGITNSQWKDIIACATIRAHPCGPRPGVTAKSLQSCMNQNCTGPQKILCEPCEGECGKSTCKQGDPPKPVDIKLCTKVICSGGGWNSAECGCTGYGGKCGLSRGSEGTCSLIHEMLHSCGMCAKSEEKMTHHCDEIWADALACCILGYL